MQRVYGVQKFVYLYISIFYVVCVWSIKVCIFIYLHFYSNFQLFILSNTQVHTQQEILCSSCNKASWKWRSWMLAVQTHFKWKISLCIKINVRSNKRGRLKPVPEPNSYLHFLSVIQSFDSAYMHTFKFELGGVKFLVKIKLYMCTWRLGFSYTLFTQKDKRARKTCQTGEKQRADSSWKNYSSCLHQNQIGFGCSIFRLFCSTYPTWTTT